MIEAIPLTLNGKPVRLEADGERPLLWILRTDLGLTGAKHGCGVGLCGACTVLVDDAAARSCQLRLKDVRDKRVVTIEGLAGPDGTLHPLQKAFVEHDAMQCGFCTPGMILTAFAFLKKNPKPTREAVLRGLDDNICRCGAHTRIVQAVLDAAPRMAGGKR
jgi:aerobic-type carbon monoxide dehydrogenase small subunit (CoxS/CutS family)